MKKSEADAWNADKVKMDNELRQMMKRVLVRKGKSVAPIESEVVSQRYTLESLLDLAKPLSYEDFLSFERSLTEQEKEELDEESALTIHRCRLYSEHDIAAKYELKLREEVEEAMYQQDAEKDLEARRDESFPKKLRREVLNFLQEDEESLVEAWTRFQTLLKQGPDLGIDENMCAQAFYMAINKASRMHLDGSAGGSFLSLTAKVGMELLGKIAENEALHKHWEEYLEPNRQCPEVMKKEESPAEEILMSKSRSMITSEQFEEIKPARPASMDLTCAPISAVSELIGAVATTGEPITLTTPPSSKEYTKIEAAILDNHLKEFEGSFAKPKGDKTLANAKPLDEFEPMDWIPIDFLQELLNMRRSFSPQDASEAGTEYNFPSNRLKSEIFDQEIIGRVLGKLYKDDIELDGTEVKQAKRLLDSCFEPSPYEELCGVYAVGVTEEEKAEPYIPYEISRKKFLKALCDFGFRVSLMTYDAFMSMPYGTQ
ncbi:hypothetical protein PR202_ga29977 [Eleusine coracana subsp. coracana]|uniref:Uncharacterized protein n=1 Tax=Eleusine coracana subsp. coracana TaxID=191504 RepID=A0AAV5DNI7_ELECO|nr:hypothetical protein PR202_ga29977 [Eleusine coracana subsp. coracana]